MILSASRLLLRIVSVLVLLAGLQSCTSGLGNQSVFEAAAGTFNYANHLGNSFLMIFRLPPGITNPISVEIRGPIDWNDGNPIQKQYTAYSDTRVVWLHVFKDDSGQPIEALPGEYMVSATIGGKKYSKVLQVDTSETIPVIRSITEEELSSTEIKLSWPPVEGADSYFVEIEDPELPQGFRKLYTASSSAQFTEMDFQAGETYALRITAFSADLTPGTELRAPQNQFNTSYIAAVLTYP